MGNQSLPALGCAQADGEPPSATLDTPIMSPTEALCRLLRDSWQRFDRVADDSDVAVFEQRAGFEIHVFGRDHVLGHRQVIASL